jgi:hypothetical protein
MTREMKRRQFYAALAGGAVAAARPAKGQRTLWVSSRTPYLINAVDIADPTNKIIAIQPTATMTNAQFKLVTDRIVELLNKYGLR